MADLKGRVAVVTGASRGIGRGIAEGLAEAGATVYLTGRSSSEASPPAFGTVQATAARVEALGGRAHPQVVDHAEDEEVVALFRRVEAEAGRLDLLVNNACPGPGTNGERRFWEASLSLWDEHCAMGLRSYYVAATLAARSMVARGSGLIINVSRALPDEQSMGTAFGVAMSGVEQMARAMARELESHGVAAMTLVPGRLRAQAPGRPSPEEESRADGERLQSPRFVGRSVAALAMDPDIMEKTGGSYRVDELVREYRFSELDHADLMAEYGGEQGAGGMVNGP